MSLQVDVARSQVAVGTVICWEATEREANVRQRQQHNPCRRTNPIALRPGVRAKYTAH